MVHCGDNDDYAMGMGMTIKKAIIAISKRKSNNKIAYIHTYVSPTIVD